MWTATDQVTGRVKTEFCPNKKELLHSIWDWKEKAEAESRCQFKAIHIDKGGKFFNILMQEWCKNLQIKLELTVEYFPDANGIAKSRNKFILERANAIRFGAGLQGSY